MNKPMVRRIAALLVPVHLLVACTPLPKVGTQLTDQQRSDAQRSCVMQYTALGSVGGALLGALLSSDKDRGKGAVMGAAAGGALAFSMAWGKCLRYYSNTHSFPVANAAQTAQAVGYTPSRGNEVRIQSFTVTPDRIAPGSSFNLNSAYYVMAPDGQKDVKVVETRTVHYFNPQDNTWKELGSEETPITAALGSRRSEGQTGMPKEVAEGRYRITFKVRALDKQDQASQEIIIRKT